MTEYLIAFNDEWVPDHTVEEIREKSRVVGALVAEMKAAGVLIFTGGLDDAAPVFGVDASSRSSSPRSTSAASPSWTCLTRRRHGCGRDGSRSRAAGRRRCIASGCPRSRARPVRPDMA
jgi:hypothetical protein